LKWLRDQIMDITIGVFKCMRKFWPRKDPVGHLLFLNELSNDCSMKHAYDERRGVVKACNNIYCTRSIRERIMSQINRAVFSLDLCITEFDLMRIRDAIIAAVNRGVTVRIITDRYIVCGQWSVQLDIYGIEVRGPPFGPPARFMHHKFLVIDAPIRVMDLQGLRGYLADNLSKVCLITGSSNWTLDTFGAHWETIEISFDDEKANQYQEEFDRMWQSF
ncbi:hypothetical protein KR018_011975, partial [Drosophila ironensis]